MKTSAVLAGPTLALLLVSSPAAGFDPFEIQVYDGTADAPGIASLELHTNYNHAPNRPVEPPELPAHKQAHFTFEPALGITRFWEIGAYVQMAAAFGDSFYWAGAKLRSKLVVPESWHPHLRLGFNVEVDALPEKFDADRYGGELRPIVAWSDRWFHLAANPNVEFALAGAGLHAGPAFSPGVAAYFRIPDVAEIGVEYYGWIGPIAHPLPIAAQEHYVFGASNVLAFEGWELNLGVGAGLTAGSNDVIVKAIIGHDLGRLWGGPPAPAAARGRVPASAMASR